MMQRLQSCMDAVVAAANVCQNWRMVDGKEDIGLLDMIAVASEFDERNPMDEDMFYVVSGEGAIGITWKWEFLVRWLYVPAIAFLEEEESSQAQIVKDQSVSEPAQGQPVQPSVMQTETAQPIQQPLIQAESVQLAQQPMAQTVSAQQPMQTIQVQPPSQTAAPKMSSEQKRFCRKCGKPLQANARFCKGCGTPVQ